MAVVGATLGAALASGFAVGAACNMRTDNIDDQRVMENEEKADKCVRPEKFDIDCVKRPIGGRQKRAPKYEANQDYDHYDDDEVSGPEEIHTARGRNVHNRRGRDKYDVPLTARSARNDMADGDEYLGWEGFSMEEARTHADEAQKIAMQMKPKEVLAQLQRGNARFWMNSAARPEKSVFQRRALISKQFPSVAILGCSDSRVPTEIVFDQGLGDIFVIRVAGNCLDTATLASLQYAVHHLKVKVLIVLGHEMCGAIKAAQLPREKIEQEPPELEQALKNLKSGLNEEALQVLRDSRSHDREAVTTNVRAQVDRLIRDQGIANKVCQEELLVVGAFYELSSGIVDFFEEAKPPGMPEKPAPAPTVVKVSAPVVKEPAPETPVKEKSLARAASMELASNSNNRPGETMMQKLEAINQAQAADVRSPRHSRDLKTSVQVPPLGSLADLNRRSRDNLRGRSPRAPMMQNNIGMPPPVLSGYATPTVMMTSPRVFPPALTTDRSRSLTPAGASVHSQPPTMIPPSQPTMLVPVTSGVLHGAPAAYASMSS